MSVRLATKNGLGQSGSSAAATNVRTEGLSGGGREGLGAGALQLETDDSILSELEDKWTLVTLVVDEAHVRCAFECLSFDDVMMIIARSMPE